MALGLQYLIQTYQLPFKVRLLGTPAEEGLGGKVQMIEAGLFDGLEFCNMIHPGNTNLAFPTYLAMKSVKVEFKGKAAHGAASPWDGEYQIFHLPGGFHLF